MDQTKTMEIKSTKSVQDPQTKIHKGYEQIGLLTHGLGYYLGLYDAFGREYEKNFKCIRRYLLSLYFVMGKYLCACDMSKLQ